MYQEAAIFEQIAWIARTYSLWRMKCCSNTTRTNTANMIDTLTYNPQPENWLYEIRQKGHDSTCYVMVPHARVRFTKNICKKIILFPQKIFSLPMWTWRCDLRRIYLVQHMRFCFHFGKTKNFLCFDYPHEIALALRIPYAWMRITWSQSRRQGWWKKKQKHTFAHDPICGITSEVFSMVDMSITRTQHSKQIRSFFSFLASVLLCVWKKQLIFLRVLLTRVRIHTHFLHCEKFSINVA